MQEFSSVAKGNVSDADLTRAKLATHCCTSNKLSLSLSLRCQLKARYLMGVEHTSCLSDDIATQVRETCLLILTSHTHTHTLSVSIRYL